MQQPIRLLTKAALLAALLTPVLCFGAERKQSSVRSQDDNHAFAFGFGGLATLGDGYGGVKNGLYLDLGYWYEAEWFALETHFGINFDANRKDPNSFIEVPLDFGAYLVPPLEHFTPFVGGGVGLHWIRETRLRPALIGAILQTSHNAESDDSAAGFGVYGKAGVILFRSYRVQMLLSVKYHVSFVTLHGVKNPQNVQFGLGMLL